MKKFVFTLMVCSISSFFYAQENSKLAKSTNPQSKDSIEIQTQSAVDQQAIEAKIKERADAKKKLIEQNQASSAKREPNPRNVQYDEKGRVIILKEQFDKLPENKQKWVIEHPDRYIIK